MPKISQLPSVTAADADTLPVVQSGVTSKTTLSSVRTLLQSEATTAGKATQRDANGAISAAAYDLDTATIASAFKQGRIRWNDSAKTAEIDMETGTVLQLGQEELIRARNNTGSTLANGVAVYITGATGNRPTIAAADADTISHAETLIGLVTVTGGIANNADGFVTTFGKVRELNTSAFAEGAVLYLSDGTAGTYSTTKPTAAGSSIVRVGFCVRSHVSLGEILVAPAFLGTVTGNAVLTAATPAAAREAIGVAETIVLSLSTPVSLTTATEVPVFTLPAAISGKWFLEGVLFLDGNGDDVVETFFNAVSGGGTVSNSDSQGVAFFAAASVISSGAQTLPVTFFGVFEFSNFTAFSLINSGATCAVVSPTAIKLTRIQ